MSRISMRVFYRLALFVSLFQPCTLLASYQYDLITNGDQRISIFDHAALNNVERNLTRQWLQKATSALLTVYGTLPKDNFHITIERSTNRSSAVPWGQVERSTPTNVLLVINPDLGYDELINDWTVFHELSHLLLPYRGYGNIWFSEGLATYYQNIIQARSGLFDETEMWRQIAAGLDRGSNDQRWDHVNLTEVSDNLHRTRQYMRVHWSGVLYWLSADIELRTKGKGTVDQALKKLKECCKLRSMTARAIAAELDHLTKTRVFIPLFNKHSKSHRVLDYKSILASLGIKQNKWTTAISLTNDTSLAEIRRQIYRP